MVGLVKPKPARYRLPDQRAGSLRGEIINKTGTTRTESTAYPGAHWVCYIGRNGRCVARARQPVIVT